MSDVNYSIPAEAAKLLHDGIIGNPLHSDAPAELANAAQSISFEGTALPSIPINWRFAESISAIKGFQGAMLNVLLKRKHGLEEYPRITINTDHAQLFIMSIALTQILDPSVSAPVDRNKIGSSGAERYFPNRDIHNSLHDWHRRAATNIYRTRDNRFYHIHGSMNPEPTQGALGISACVDPEPASPADAVKPYAVKVAELAAAEIDELMNGKNRQAGTICYSAEEYLASEHGRANAHVGLYELHHHANPEQPPAWWPAPAGADPKRPLFGLKVVELARVIAAPSVTRELAELGASVMRITAPHITDMSALFPDLNWGKWEAELDLREEADKEKLRALIMDADVVLDGYRPGVMQKWGFGKDDILNMRENSEKGIIYARENCYGWQGPWAGRSGWQQISDACCGVSLGFGRAMGNDEPVTPVFPNSDYCTGASGATGVLQALIERGSKGGSYVVDIALNYYSQWLINSCGEYPTDVFQDVWDRNGHVVFRHDQNMLQSLPVYIGMILKSPLMTPGFFEERESKAIGVKLRTPKPVLCFPSGEVELRFNVGTRGNGVDRPVWPENLLTEVVA